MTQETAPFVALRAVQKSLKSAAYPGAHLDQRMVETALEGRGFTLLVERQGVVQIYDDRANCEASAKTSIWALTEAARGRSLTEACKIHGFEIVEVPPAGPEIVWIVEGEHWEVPGIRQSVHRTEAGANAKAAEILNALISDAIGPGGCLIEPGALPEVSFELDQATAENWREVNEVFRREMGNIDLGGEEFEPTDEPPFGVTMTQRKLEA